MHKNWLPILLIIALVEQLESASITTNISSTSSVIGSLSTITLIADRTKSNDGTTIVPTIISTSIYNILLTFDTSFGIINGTTQVMNGMNFTIDSGTNSITIRYNSSQFGTTPVSLTVAGVRNPIVSGIALAIYMKISDANNVLKDQSFNTLTYTSATFSTSDITYTFTPANVSTISNLTLVVKSAVYDASRSMYMEISFRKFWLRSLVNNTGTAIFSSATSCIPACVTNRQTTATLVVFPNTSLSSSYNPATKSLTLTLVDIQSPPTLQPADQIQIFLRESQYISIIQRIDSYAISAGLPNSLQSVTTATLNTISQVVSLNVGIVARNVFGPNDMIKIRLVQGGGLVSSDVANIGVTGTIISSCQKDIQDMYTIVLSQFVLYSPGILDAVISLNKVAMAVSTKPRVRNIIQIYRNGYLYAVDTFDYSVNAAQMTDVSVVLTNNYANSIANATWKLRLSKGLLPNDTITLSLPKQITLISCLPQCQSCTCSITQSTLTTPFSTLLITLPASLPSSPLSQLSIITTQRNPISNTSQISVCTGDSQQYIKQCSNVSYPSIVQASLSMQTLSVVLSNASVYGVGVMMVYYNFSSYDLQDGFLVTVLPVDVGLVDVSAPVCRINGQPQCRISTNSTGTYINTTVSSTTKTYTLSLSNIRNPTSTKPFLISAKVAYISNQFYYSIVSDYINVTNPYILQPNTHYTTTMSNCINYQISNTSVSFVSASLPFGLAGTGGTGVWWYRVRNGKSGAEDVIGYNGGSMVVFTKRNWYSFQPVMFTYTLWTSNLLYKVWQFSVTEQNCQASVLPIIGYEFTGLPQSAGTLRIAYTNSYSSYILANSSSYSIVLKFPQQYSQTTLPTVPQAYTLTSPSPRTFIIKASQSQQPVFLQLSNFTNPLNINPSNNYINNPIVIQIYDNNYLISQDNSTVKYVLADISDCKVPCRVCAGGDGVDAGVCLGCYGANVTASYLLNGGTGRCVGVCPTGSYSNGSACITCPTSCSTCTSGTSCQSCTNNYYLYQSQCVTSCPSLFYPSTISQTCQACTPPCSQCLSQSLCKSCRSGYNLYQSTCVAVCPTSYLVQTVNSTSICYKCLLPCLQCAGSLSLCTKCVDGYYIQGNACVQDCGAVMIGYQGFCVSCSSTCDRCIQIPSKCIQCASPYYLYNSTCILNCPTSYYPSLQTCQTCPPGCTTCTNATSCQTCTLPFIFYNNTCILSCPSSTYIHNISNTSTNTLISQQCKPCSSSQCLVCNAGPSQCTVCVGGLYLFGGSCWQSCPTGMFGDGLVCSSCGVGCLACVSVGLCVKCADQYALSDNACISQCPQLTTVQVNNTCVACGSYFGYCQQCTSLGCVSCLSGYSLYSPSTTTVPTCVLTCPTSYLSLTISSIQKCLPCSPGCQSCSTSPTSCTSCLSSYFYFQSTCLTQCPSPTIPVSSICRACDVPCLTCANNDTKYCVTCVSGYNRLVNGSSRVCIVGCPVGYYVQEGTGDCVGCAVGCRGCVGVGCLECVDGYFLVTKNVTGYNGTLYQCYSSCPSHLPYIIGNRMCSKCSQYCLQCNTTTCLQCQPSYYSHFEFCLLTCPPPYTISTTSKSCILPDPNTTNTTNNTDNTNTTTTTATVKQLIDVPVPFSIVSAILILLVLISKLQYGWTNGIMSMFGWVSTLTIVCYLVYGIFGLQWVVDTQASGTNGNQNMQVIKIMIYLLFVAVGVIYVSNILHAVFGCATFRNDPQFTTYATSHRISNIILFITCILLQHTTFVLYFSHFMNLSPFRATLKNPFLLSNYLNYIWSLALVANILAFIIGIILISKSMDVFLYVGIDLIVVDVFVVVAGLVLLRKGKGMGWAAADYAPRDGYEGSEEQYATKKVVIMDRDGDSDAHIASVICDSLQQINGKLTKNILDNPSNQPQNKDQFYFQQQDGDNKLPTNPNNSQQQTQINKKDQNNNSQVPQNQSIQSETLKIQPSINVLLTAQEMKPGKSVIGDESMKGQAQMKERGRGVVEEGREMSLGGWSDIDRDSRVLKNQSIVTPHKNIFQLQQSQPNKSPALKNISKVSPSKNTNNDNKSQNSSKSLKVTPKTTKYKQDMESSDDNKDSDREKKKQNLATQRLNKNRNRMSQQIASINNTKQQKDKDKGNNKGSHKNLRKSSNIEQGINRPKSKVSNRLLNSQLNQITQQQQENAQKVINNNRSKQKQKHKDQHLHIDEQEVQTQDKSIVMTVRGQERFISKTLQQDHGMELIDAQINNDMEGMQVQEDQYRRNQVQTAGEFKRNNSKSISRKSASQDKSRKKILKERKHEGIGLKYSQKQQKQDQIQSYNEKQQIGQDNQPKNNQQIKQYENQNEKPIEGANTIFVQTDQQKQIEGKGKRQQKNYFTISGGKTLFPASADTLQTSSKLRTLQLRQQLRKQSQNQHNKHKSLSKANRRSFRSRNISVDKLRPNTSDQTIDHQPKQYEIRQGQGTKINAKALMKQIERKQKLRHHQQSLKKIYLRK